jgi:hypothetical protein
MPRPHRAMLRCVICAVPRTMQAPIVPPHSCTLCSTSSTPATCHQTAHVCLTHAASLALKCVCICQQASELAGECIGCHTCTAKLHGAVHHAPDLQHVCQTSAEKSTHSNTQGRHNTPPDWDFVTCIGSMPTSSDNSVTWNCSKQPYMQSYVRKGDATYKRNAFTRCSVKK